MRRVQFRGAVMWAGAEALVSLLAAIAVSLLVGRLIGAHAFGLASLAYLIGLLAEALVALPYTEALIRRPKFSVQMVDAAFTGALVNGALAFLGLLALAPVIAAAYAQPELALLIQVQAITCLSLGVRAAPEAVFARKLRFRTLSRLNIMAKVCASALTIGMALSGFGAWSVIIGNVVLGFALMLLIAGATPRKPRFCPHLPAIRELLGFGVFSVIDNFLGVATPRVFNALVGYFFGVGAVGLTSMAFRINDGVGALLSLVTARMALPMLSRTAHDRTLFAAMLRDGTRLTFLVAAPVFVGLAFVSHDLIQLLLGPGWEGAADALVAVNLFSLANFSCVLAQPAVKALGKPARWILVQVAGCGFVVAGVALTARLGMPAPLFVWALFGLIWFAAATFVLRWTSGITYRDQVTPFLRLGLALLGMTTVLWAVDASIPFSSSLQALVSKAAIGAAVYIALVWVLESATLRDILRREPTEASQ